MPIVVEKTWDDQRLKRDRLGLLRAEMERRGIGALFLSDSKSVRYALNLKIPGADVFVPLQGDALGFIRPRDMGYVKMSHENVQPPFYRRGAITEDTDPEEAGRFTQGILELLDRHGGRGGRLGVIGLGPDAIMALAEAGVTPVDATPVLEWAGGTKTPDEVAIYRSIGEQYAHVFNAFRESVRPGISENELAGVVVTAWYEVGGEDIAQLNVCTGENMNPWRRWPSQRTLKEGELVGIDLHGRAASGLRGDASCTLLVGGQPTQEQRDLYRQAHAYLRETIPIFRAGLSIAEVVEAVPPVPEKYRKHQYTYGVAHGMGMGSSGYPHVDLERVSPDDVLHPNQVLAIECYFGEEGSSLAVKLEVMILVTPNGPEVLGPGIPIDERLAS